MTEQEILKELENFDTPSITNVVATYPNNPLCLGLYNPWTETGTRIRRLSACIQNSARGAVMP